MAKHPHSNETFITILTLVNLLFLCVLALWLFNTQTALQSVQTKSPITPTPTPAPTITSANYNCNNKKTIQAVYFNNMVELQLSDKRDLLLIQGLSGSGVRFTNSNESITFWNKGNTAFIEEGPQSTVTYNNCVQTTTSQ